MPAGENMLDDQDTVIPNEEQGAAPAHADAGKTPEHVQKLVEQWTKRIKASKAHFEKDFERMDVCMDLAAEGANDDWIDGDKYVVPVLNRHINQAVSQLYAKHPTAIAKRRKRLLHTVWDGKPESLQSAMFAMQSGDPDLAPAAMLLIEDIVQAQQQNEMTDNMGETLQILWEYFMGEQAYSYKEQIKAAVRRTKVCGVAYFKVDFQRILEKRPEIVAQIEDVTSKIAHVRALLSDLAEGEMELDSPLLAELESNLRDLENQQDIVAREGPVIDFPGAKEIIIDKNCRHLKTLAGARWIAHEFDMTPTEINETYKVRIDQWTKYNAAGEKEEKGNDKSTAKLWAVQDKKLQQHFVVCDGYPDFIVPPATPKIYLERFFSVIPLVFNEIEHDKKLYPPSDVWLARHTQSEYNRSREGLREHRIANRPFYVVEKGRLEESDKAQLQSHDAHAIIEVNAIQVGQKVEDLVQRAPLIPIDPNQYQVNDLYTDMLRTVGTQEANLGGTSGATATESSIAEESRAASTQDNVDDLDDALTHVAKALKDIMLLNLSKETVIEIVGPGAVWPDAPETRERVAKELLLETKAASSGRPNQAADLANAERAMPTLIQLPGVNPEPLVRKYAKLLDIDMEELYVPGGLSIQALNALMGSATQPAAEDPTNDPNAQGAEGAQNTAQPDGAAPGGQPEYPAPQMVA